MINGDNSFWNWSSIKREHFSQKPRNGLPCNPLGQLCLIKVCPLTVLVLPLTGSDCYFKCLTTLWKGPYREIKHFSLPFTWSSLFVVVSNQVSLQRWAVCNMQQIVHIIKIAFPSFTASQNYSKTQWRSWMIKLYWSPREKFTCYSRSQLEGKEWVSDK